jgi:antitoxin HigA-1
MMALERRIGAGWTVHPGEILKKEFLEPLEISGYRLAHELGVKAQSINDIVLQKRGISADMAVRLGRFFHTSPEFWFNLQSAFDLARAVSTLKRKLSKIQPFKKAA